MTVTGKGAYPLRSTWGRGRGRGRGRGTSNLYRPVYLVGNNDEKELIWTDWFFEASTPPGATGQVKIWNGSAWVAKPVKIWSGAAWVVKPAKYWNGTSWVVTPY